MSLWLGHTTLAVEDCEDAWNESVNANVTASTSTDYQAGTKSASLTLTGNVASGNNLATEAVTLDLSAYTHVALWVKSSVTLAAGALLFVMDEDAACASPSESLALPALTAGQWTACVLTFAAATSTRNAIVSVGLKTGATVSSGTVILVDDIRALTARQFSTLKVRGLNRPDNVQHSKAQVVELLNGDMYEMTPPKSRRIITVEFPPLTETEQAWIESWLRQSDKRVIGTNDFVRVVNGDPGKYGLEWLNDVSIARRAVITVVEKTGWTVQPSSWSYA